MFSTTRLVVLGAIYQFQPVHGYFLRRELLTWNVDEWANIQPGSIYNALRSLKKDGYVVETGTEVEGNRPERTVFEMTPEGEAEFFKLLREALWTVRTFDPKPVMALTSFMFALSRQEVLQALAVMSRDVVESVEGYAANRRVVSVVVVEVEPAGQRQASFGL